MLMDLMWFCMDLIHVDCYGFEFGFTVSAPWGVRWELVYGVAAIGAALLTFSDVSTSSTPRPDHCGSTRYPYAWNTYPYHAYV